MKQNFFEVEYNPKIDYLITKNLLTEWPHKYNEFDLRRAFNKKFGRVEKDLKRIRKIRKYLSKKKIINFTKKDYENMIRLITNEKYEYHYKIKFSDMTLQKLDDYVSYLKALDSFKIAYSCLSLMILYVCAKNNEIIIPYRGTIKRCLNNENLNVYSIISILKERTKHNNIKHNKEENEVIRKVIKDKKEDFLNSFKKVKAYGIYGSFAMKKENEYSDLDMLVVCDEEYSYSLEHEIYTYWRQFINIEMDIKIVKEDDIDQELTECMKKTLRMVA